VADSNSDLYGYVPFGNEPFYYLSNAKYLDTTQEWPQASFENSDLIALLNQLAPLVKERSLFPYDSGGSRSNTGNYEERNDIIKFGKGALWIDQTGMPRVQNVILPQTQFKVGYAVLPIQQSLNPAFVISLFISRRATNPQVCWAWLEFLAQQQANIFKGIPMQQTILESENWANSVGNEQADVYRATLSKLKITNEANNWPPLPLSKWWADAVEAVTREGQDSNIVLHSIQFKAQDTLDCMRAAGVPPSIPYDQSYFIAIDCASASDPEYQK
jgi:ABC-type glycerol-3-phosphate transport system substrate-binding protein